MNMKYHQYTQTVGELTHEGAKRHLTYVMRLQRRQNTGDTTAMSLHYHHATATRLKYRWTDCEVAKVTPMGPKRSSTKALNDYKLLCNVFKNKKRKRKR